MEPTLPKLTAKILESEVSDIKYSSGKHRSRKPVKKRDIGWPTDFRHSSHIGFMDNNSMEGIVQIEVDGKLVYVDSKTMEKIQNANLSSPVLEGKEWAIDAPASISPSKRPRPKRIPVLADTNEKVFAQPVTSTDSPTSPILYDVPFSTKRIPAPPPPTTKKPALKPVPKDFEIVGAHLYENVSIQCEHSDRIAQIEEKVNELTEELEKLRKEKLKLLAEVKMKEEEQKIKKQEAIEYEPFIQAHVIDRLSSVSTDLSPAKETLDFSHTEQEEEPHSPPKSPIEGLPEAIKKFSKTKKESEASKILPLSKDQELEKLDLEKIKQFTESVAVSPKVSIVKSEEAQPFKPIPPPRRKQPSMTPPPITERSLRKSQDLESPSGSEVFRL